MGGSRPGANSRGIAVTDPRQVREGGQNAFPKDPAMTTLSPALSSPSCGTLVTADGRTLPLAATRLEVRAAAGLAAVRLVQTFRNPFAEPLHVTYQLPLPAEAAVGGFAFRIGDEHVVGEIDRRAAARERFEQALASGRTAALLEQDRSSLFTQELGNVPPGAEIEATIDVDQPLLWQDGGWQWRFPTTVAPRYLGAAGRVADADRIAVDVVDPSTPLPPRCELLLMIDDVLVVPGPGAVRSPSHGITIGEPVDPCAGALVLFGTEDGRVAMDRDVVVTWQVAAPAVGLTLRTLQGERGLAGQAFGLLTLVPPRVGSTLRRRQRDLIVLLDISGSMHGAPLAQAQAVTASLIGSLDAEDRLELIAFASRPEAWQRKPVFATAANKAAALRWLHGLQASGSTEMHDAILAALHGARAGVQRQVVLVSDGQIGFEREIVGAISNGLPAHARVHVVGVGSAPNRTLTRGAARAGRGLEVLIGIGEDPVPAAQRLLTRTASPLVDELQITGSAVLACAPAAMPDVFGGAPARLALRLRPEGGTLVVRGATVDGPFVHELHVAPIAGGDAAIGRLFGRECVEDLEVALAAGAPAATIDAQIEALGLAHRIATRQTSWIAVAAELRVDPRSPQRHVVVPQELPHGMSIERLGLRGRSLPVMAECDELLAAPAPSVCRAMPAGMPAPKSREVSKKERVRSPRSDLGQAKADGADGAGGARAERRQANEPPAPPSPPPTVRARLRSRGDGGWIFAIDGLATWHAPLRVTVVFAEGREVELAVDAARTTLTGPLLVGVHAQLVLLALAAMPTAAAVRLRWTDGSVVLDVPIA